MASETWGQFWATIAIGNSDYLPISRALVGIRKGRFQADKLRLPRRSSEPEFLFFRPGVETVQLTTV